MALTRVDGNLIASGVSLTFNAGNAAFPALTTTGDTNTGIFFPAADTIAFTEGGAESMRINSSGNVGIGISSPAGRLSLLGAFGTTQTAGLTIGSTGSTTGLLAPIAFYLQSSDWGTVHQATIAAQQVSGTDSGANLIFSTSATGASTPTERARITSTGLVGIATTSPRSTLDVNGTVYIAGGGQLQITGSAGSTGLQLIGQDADVSIVGTMGSQPLVFRTASSERARIDSSGNFLVGKTATGDAAGCTLYGIGLGYFIRSSGNVLEVNRLTDDGILVAFYQDSTLEGSISVSGTTVSYNGGHLSRYAQTTTAKDESIVKGTVLSNLDEMNVYTKDGQPVANEQLNKVKVSDTEGDVNVAGVFVNWSHDEDHNVDEINMAMTGDMIIRIAQGVTVVRGDLLMSAGNGTAKPQGDDIIRSKTVAKVTSNHVTCTYADGSYCVPCVLMAC